MIRHQMAFLDPTLLLFGQLPEHLTQMLPQLSVQHLAATLGDKHSCAWRLTLKSLRDGLLKLSNVYCLPGTVREAHRSLGWHQSPVEPMLNRCVNRSIHLDSRGACRSSPDLSINCLRTVATTTCSYAAPRTESPCPRAGAPGSDSTKNSAAISRMISPGIDHSRNHFYYESGSC
jgi:hypothetical protein